MAKQINILSPKTVEKLTTKGRHHDGGGLYLKVTETGARSWVLRYQFQKRERWMGLGGYPAISLAEARRTAAEHRTELARRVDPLEVRKAARDVPPPPRRMTFGEVAEGAMEKRQREGKWRNPKTAESWRRGIKKYAASLYDMPAEDVDTTAVLRVLEPLWAKRAVTANQLRVMIESVWNRAQAFDLVPGNRQNPARWAGHMEELLPPLPKVEKHPALPYRDLPAYFAKIREIDTPLSWLMQFTVLTACRSGESRGATWSEVTLNNGKSVWNIPGGRMKGKADHEVPLSKPAREVLTRAIEIKREGDDFVFPGQRRGQPFSDAAFVQIRPAGYSTHGFRTTFATWAKEQTDYDKDLIELALAHSIGRTKSEDAYAGRTTMIEKRRALMIAWGQFCVGQI